MKNKCFLLLLFLLLGVGFLPVSAANVHFPDPNLRAAIVEALGKSPGASVTTADMETFTQLDLTGKGIRDLTGLSHASRLEGLKLTNNLISDLTPISGMIQLGFLHIGDNVVSDLSPLTSCKALWEIRFFSNLISDLTPLGELPHLNIVWFDSNIVSDLSPLVACRKLNYISSWGNPIADLSPVAQMPQLRLLNISESEVTDISPLTGKISLREVYLRYNERLEDFTPLASLISLERLSLRGSNIKNTEPLMGLKGLKWLVLFDTPVSKNDVLDLQVALPATKIIWYSDPEDPSIEDVNADGNVDILDLILVGQDVARDAPALARTDVDGNGIVNIKDLLIVASRIDALALAAPSLIAEYRNAIPQGVIHTWIATAQAADDGSVVFQRGIETLQRLLDVYIPKRTVLLANYPNPFNPETWIPYTLSASSDVRIVIFDIKGSIVRHLDLGFQAAGFYHSKGKAAYWNGRNNLGESVATGVYFYQLGAEKISDMKKMTVIR